MVSASHGRPWVVGIAGSHNGAVCLLHGDEVVVAIQEERLLRSKRARLHGRHTGLSLAYCLDHAGITARDLDAVVLCAQDDPRSPRNDLTSNPGLAGLRAGALTATIPHHLGHAYGAFATSGLDRAAVLVVDGVGSRFADLTEEERRLAPEHAEGDAETVSIYGAEGSQIRPLAKHFVREGAWLHHPEDEGGLPLGLAPSQVRGMPRFGSLGGMYAAVGWQVFGDGLDGAGKLMGLAPYGRATTPVADFLDVVDHRLVFHDHVPRRFQHNERWPAHADVYRDLAASTQVALEVALMHLTSRALSLTGSDALCYAGGVALNSVANERIVREGGFRDVFLMPAAEDSGTALGAAYYGLWQLTGRNAQRPPRFDALGRTYSRQEIDEAIRATPTVSVSDVPDVIEEAVDRLCDGSVVGWFEGRSELGPRALGMRSILCDPRRPDAKAKLNERVKHREAFRPFAPMILREEVTRWFEIDERHADSPYMLRVARFRAEKRALVPGVVHVDGTGRLQTITRAENGRIHQLIEAFHRRTGVPILLNTSFNVAGEPIVEDPADALWCLVSTGIDCCVLGDRIVSKQDRSLLDLRVRLVADTLSSVRYVVDGALRPPSPLPFPPFLGVATEAMEDIDRLAAAARLDHLRIVGHNRWGSVTHFADLELNDVLRWISDGPTGRELLASLTRHPPERGDARPWDEASLVALLTRLRRAAIVTLTEA